MSIKDDFETFVNNLKPDNISDMEKTVGEIAKKLNKNYYNLDSDSSSNMYIVGSVGRETSIKGVSDLDILFDLPNEVFKKFDAYKESGQSSLLQEVKGVLQERYPTTDISGDGQVVVINFNKYTVELVPGFKQSDNRFKYPDTNDGGSWKYTDPLPEIEESKKTSEDTNDNFKYISNMLRAWKNKQSFKFGGLLIDTVTYDFLNSNEDYKTIDFGDYLNMTKDLYNYLKELKEDQSYWYALGSNQQVYNTGNGKFIRKAKKTYNKIIDLEEDSEDLNTKLREVFGNQFPKAETVTETASLNKAYNAYGYNNTEQFIEDMFPIDIRYDITLDCKVTQDGWRDRLLSYILKNHEWLRPDKNLDFYISYTDARNPYEIYWKVKNEGEIAKAKNQIRGQIIRTNKSTQHEVTSFRGEHYVECYIVKNGICVARDRIDVPIVT
ncbi:MAG: nucleotide-binding domain-containing protein [Solirubrobacterales bacterium]